MSRTVFEVKRTDAAGRIGQLDVPRSDLTIETPAMLPVVNPHVQQIEPARLADEFGAEILITNSYVLYGSEALRDVALRDGLHDLLGFSGAIMTDSGSFQLAEYGEIDVDTKEILDFQYQIGTDIATPVDIPVPPDADRETAEQGVADTTKAIEIASEFDAGEMLVSAPVQGSTYPDLRTQAAREAYALDLDVYPIGAVVPLLREYRFDDVSRIVDAAKRGLGTDAPVHLFGAGHPMMFALAVALGCDLFDSAAYALYAREGRYLTVGGTHHLEDLTYFPCACPICTDTTPEELREWEEDAKEEALAAHNLHVTFGEIKRVREAITQGELIELVERRVRAHPRLLDGYRAALEDPERLESEEPATSPRPMFYVSNESAQRPEVLRHHERLARIETPASLLLVERGVDVPAHVNDGDRWDLIPPFGPVPPALAQTYPLTAELPNMTDETALKQAATGVRSLSHGRTLNITLVHDDWPAHILETLPTDVRSVVAGEAL